jgi:hypothetical protein
MFRFWRRGDSNFLSDVTITPTPLYRIVHYLVYMGNARCDREGGPIVDGPLGRHDDVMVLPNSILYNTTERCKK